MHDVWLARGFLLAFVVLLLLARASDAHAGMEDGKVGKIFFGVVLLVVCGLLVASFLWPSV